MKDCLGKRGQVSRMIVVEMGENDIRHFGSLDAYRGQHCDGIA
jgi:hypothetical protein